MLQIELKRAFKRKTFIIALVVCTLFCVGDYLISNYVYYSYASTNQSVVLNYLKGVVVTSYQFFIFFNLTSFANILFVLIPIIVAVSYSDSYLEDLNSGFLKNILIRCSRRKYLLNKFIANFIVSGITIAVPLIINFILTLTTQVSMTPYKLTSTTLLNGNLNIEMYIKHPILYVLMWIGIYFVFAGAISSIALAFSIVTRNKFIVLIAPFIVIQAMDILLRRIGMNDFNVSKLLYLCNNVKPIGLGITFLVIFLGTFLTFYFGGKSNEGF